MEIPQGLDEPYFDDAMPVPQVYDPRNIAGQKIELGLPEPLSTTFGVDHIVIKRLGENRWVFIDSPPAMVWPKVRQFWADNKLPLAYADPSRGIMESEWLIGRGDTAEALFDALASGTAWADSSATSQHKFRLSIEPGIRTGSSEIYIEHHSRPVGGPVRLDNVEWTGDSDDNELEGVLLSKVAFYMGERIGQRLAVSKVAAQFIGGERAELVPDRQMPVLKYKLDFDRAWATVGDALENARIDVEDLDRTKAVYLVHYDESTRREPGFIGRIFGAGKGEDELVSDENRYVVQLADRESEVRVTVLKDDTTPADALIAEQLLKLIKEYST